MKREPVVYAALLAAALLVAFRSWRQPERLETPGTVALWRARADRIQAIEFVRPGHRVDIQRHAAGTDSTYLWAIADTASFLVGGQSGADLLDALAEPQALRDLGKPSAADRHAFGLDTSRTRLLVRLPERTQELLIGAQVYSTGEHYVLETRTGHVYVLTSQAVQSLENAPQMLVERRLHAFTSDKIGSVAVTAVGRTRTMFRTGDNPTTGGNWATTAASKPDVSFAGFMQQLEGLWIAGYTPRENAATLTRVLRVEYTDKRGKPLGYLELFTRPGAGPTPEYYMRTELTHVLVRTITGSGENVTRDLPQLL